MAVLKKGLRYYPTLRLKGNIEILTTHFCNLLEKRNTKTCFTCRASSDSRISNSGKHTGVHAISIVSDNNGQLIRLVLLNNVNVQECSVSVYAILCDLKSTLRQIAGGATITTLTMSSRCKIHFQ